MHPAIRERIIGRVEPNKAAVRALTFLAAEPDRWFSSDVIEAHARVGVHPVARLLDELADDGFLRRREVGELALYALTQHREVRDAALYLAARERRRSGIGKSLSWRKT